MNQLLKPCQLLVNKLMGSLDRDSYDYNEPLKGTCLKNYTKCTLGVEHPVYFTVS